MSAAKFRPADYSGPRFWPVWLLLGLLWLLTRLPLTAQLCCGRRVGDMLYFLHGKRRAIARANLARCFPERGDARRQVLLRESFQAFGMSLFETASLWFRQPQFLLRHCLFTGLEHLQAATASGRGIILLHAHFTTMEVGGSMLATRIPLDVTYDPPKNALLADFLRCSRLRYARHLIDNHNIRQMVRRLRDGGCVWYAPDQHVSAERGGLHTTFFGHPVLTIGGVSRMARISNALVLPLLATRDPQQRQYHLRVLPPLPDFPGDSTGADTQRINDVFAAQARAFPEQYFWLHNRFRYAVKTGAGEP